MKTKAKDPHNHSDETHCVHGVYTGTWCGPDYMCGLCEDGFTSKCPVCKRFTFMSHRYGKQVRCCAGCGRDLRELAEIVQNREDEIALCAFILQEYHNGNVGQRFTEDTALKYVERGTQALAALATFATQLTWQRKAMHKHYINRL